MRAIMTPMESEDRDAVRRTIGEINRAWRDQRFDDLTELLDETVIMKGPGLRELVRGRANLIESYRYFMSRSRIDRYEESNHSVDVWSGAAAATYNWEMLYEQGGEVHHDFGQDMFVLVRRDSRWIAVLRVMLF